jgi:DNA-binding PadR family transcriptional regulator
MKRACHLIEMGEGKEMTPLNHRERQFMERLHGAGWVKEVALPSSPKIIQSLLSKGWIESRSIENRLCYRITDQGLAAKKMPVRI